MHSVQCNESQTSRTYAEKNSSGTLQRFEKKFTF